MQTPIYVYSLSNVENNYKSITSALVGIASNIVIAFSMKSCNNEEVLRRLISQGSGIDCVSYGELKAAILYGADPMKIVLAGVGKTDEEIMLAIESGILQINVESSEELVIINEIATRLNKKPRIALRINPHLDAKDYTHAKISTGSKGNKFGIDISDASSVLALMKTLKNIEFVGFSCHIGSQIFDLSVFATAFESIRNLVFDARKYGLHVVTLDFGGGMGFPYSSEQKAFDILSYVGIVKSCIANLDIKTVIFEPGRIISASAGILISKVLYIKKTSHANFLILDAGMNNLIRPAMYGARHEIAALKPRSGHMMQYTVVGSICESSDIFGVYDLPQLERGDYISILSSGAYGEVMQSNYNLKLQTKTSICGETFAEITSQFIV